jgi:hypothetical protein
VSDEPGGPPTPAVRPLVVLGLFGVLLLPLVLAAMATARRATWFPVLDLAMTELRVRDVGGAHTPLIGLPGRIGTFEQQGSHPGPLSFYLLAPTYRVLGSSAWALQVATLVVHAMAMGTALWIARRRGGLRTVLAVGALLAVLAAAYGFPVLAEPWNPYLPLVWWVAFLLAAWAVADGDWVVLPVAVLAASACAQTHLPYLGLTGAIGVVAVVLGGLGSRGMSRRVAVVPVAVAVAIAAVLWAPVVVDEVANDPGNASLLRGHMLEPPEATAGLATGARTVVEHLDLRRLAGASEGGRGSLVDPSHTAGGSVLVGSLVLVLWGAAAITAWRLGTASLLRLHVVVAAGLALGAYSTARVFGPIWYYLTLWAFGLAVLAVVATGVTAAVVVERRLDPDHRARSRQVTTVALCALVAIAVASLVARVPGLDPPAERMSRALGLVLDPTEEALLAGEGAADGSSGRYVVTWSDALHIGSAAYGLVSELQRRGLDVGAMPWAAVPMTEHRVVADGEATAVVHLATGAHIDRARQVPGAVEVARADPRTAAERAEFDALRAQVGDDLVAAGLGDLIPRVDGNLFGAALHPDLDPATRRRIGRMLDLGAPVAVFVAPPGTLFW